MRRQTLWAMLGVTLVLSAIAWWLERTAADAGIVQVAERAASLAAPAQADLRTAAVQSAAKPRAQMVAVAATGVQVQAAGLRTVIQVDKQRDPFGLYQPPAPPPKPVKAAAAPPPPPAPPPQAPPFTYQLFGRMLGPDGKQMLYLVQGERLVAVQEGTELDSGFAVEKLTEQELLIRHKPTQQEVRLSLPKQSL